MDPAKQAKPAALIQPRIIPRPEHPVSRANIASNALKVLYRLRDGGYQAFIVGGGIRDLLLGLHPTDFDVATNARPADVKRLFRNCRLIGRRFRLAHVHFGRDYVEVATFRAAHDIELDEIDEEHRALDEHGRIVRDNLYGSIEEDVWRRDFTCNALYYNIEDFSIWDYVGGYADIERRVLRLIGDPVTRYREDPVRMLRAVRFAAKLGFELDPETERPLAELGRLLAAMPPARLFDETLKLFLTGHGQCSFELLLRYDLLRHLFPDTERVLMEVPDGPASEFIRRALQSTDARVAADKPVTPVFLFAAMLWEPVRRETELLEIHGMDEQQAIREASDAVVGALQRHVALPKRFGMPMRELLMMQPKFRFRDRRRVQALLGHPRFRAAYDLMALRAEVEEESPGNLAWWTRIQTLSPEEREREFQSSQTGGPRRRRRGGRRGRKPARAES